MSRRGGPGAALPPQTYAPTASRRKAGPPTRGRSFPPKGSRRYRDRRAAATAHRQRRGLHMNLGTIFLSELVGTAMLVLLGCGVVANVALIRNKGHNGGFL